MASKTIGWKLGGKYANLFRNDVDHREFTAIGTAAGVATAFGAPIGGALFTIEEGCSFYSTFVFWRCFIATCSGVLTLHGLVEALWTVYVKKCMNWPGWLRTLAGIPTTGDVARCFLPCWIRLSNDGMVPRP